MKTNGKYLIEYSIKGEKKKIEVIVKLIKHNEILKPFQNLWYGVATLNGAKVDRDDLANCVNAQYMAEDIAEEELQKLRLKYGSKLRVKKR